MENVKQDAPNKKISEKDLEAISTEEITKNLNDIIFANVAVWRKNIENNLVVLPVKKLDEYLKEQGADKFKFFIEKNWKERIKEVEAISKKETEQAPVADEVLMKKVEKFGKVEEQVSQFGKMTVVEREEVLDECLGSLSEVKEAGKLDIPLIVKMVNVISNTFYANNADIEAHVTTSDQKESIYGVLVKSDWIIKILNAHFNRENYPYINLGEVEKISTGSKTMDHINRVFLNFIAFCNFFNEYIGKGLFTRNIRGVYKDRYHRYYKKRFPDIEVTIEKIFQNGVRRIDMEKEIEAYSLGALLFDIGKIRDIPYHDSADPFNEETIKKHVLNGFNMIVKAKQYPFDVMAMAVFHHEYYGGKGSYNFTKPLLSKFSGKKFTEDNIKYFITYEKDEFINGTALSYFPCKVIEILDIFDALTGKKSVTPVEAFKTMKKEFITKSFKIDPILFKIFMEYIFKCGRISEKEVEEIDSIIF